MKLPIPNDWNGQDWQCVTIYWPDSTLWQAILTGLISMPGAGRFWSEDSGRITDAQSIGRQIWDRNLPLMGCDGEPCEPCEPCSIIPPIIGDTGEDDNDMAVQKVYIDTETCELVVEYGGCSDACRFPLNCSTAPTSDMPDDFTPPGGGEGGDEYSACGKAYAAVHAVMQLAASVWTHSNDITLYPFKAISEENPGVEFDSYWKWIAKGLGAVGQVEPFFFEWTDQADKEQMYLCYALPLFTDTPENDFLTEGMFDKFENVFMGQTAIDRLLNPWWGTYLRAIIWMIGKDQLGEISTNNAGDTSQDCACPEVADPEVPVGVYSWVVDFNFTEGDCPPWQYDENVTRDTNGFWVNDPGGQYYAVNGGAQLDPTLADGTTKLKYAAFYYDAPLGWGGGVNPKPLRIASTPEVQLIPGSAWPENVAPGATKKVWASVEGEGLASGIELQVGIDGYDWYNNAHSGPMYIKRIILAGDGTQPFDITP